MPATASFSTLPPEIHRQIFANVFQNRAVAHRRKYVAIFGNGGSWANKKELARIHPIWRELVQEELYDHLRLPHALTTAEEDIDELIQLVQINPSLGSKIKRLTIEGPYGDQATLHLWVTVKKLLQLLDPQVNRMVSYQPYIGATSNGLLDMLNLETPSVVEKEERVMLEKNSSGLSALRIGDVKGINTLHFISQVSYSLEIGQEFVQAVLDGMTLEHLTLQTTDYRRQRQVRRNVFKGICTTLTQTVIPMAIGGSLRSFTLQYPTIWGSRKVELLSRVFAHGPDLCNALRSLSTSLVKFELIQASISTALFLAEEGNPLEWPQLEYYVVKYSAIDSNGFWWNKLEEGLIEVEIPDEVTFYPHDIDELIVRRSRPRRTLPNPEKWNELIQAASKSLLAMPKIKTWLLHGASERLCLPKVYFNHIPRDDVIQIHYSEEIDDSDDLMALWRRKVGDRGHIRSCRDFH